MQHQNHSPQGFKLKTGGAALLLAAGGLLSVNTAHAVTSAGAELTNNVEVTYTDAAAIAQTPVFASVSVTVALVPGVAWGSTATVLSTNSGLALTDPGHIIELLNLGNGNDDFDVSNASSDPACAGTLLADSFDTPDSFLLGATVSALTATFLAPNTTVQVSHLVTGAAGLAPGDTVRIGGINGNTYEVVSATAGAAAIPATPTVAATPETNGVLVLTDSAVGTGTDDATGDLTGPGIQIGEVRDYNFGDGGVAGLLSGAASCQHSDILTADGTLAAANGGNTEATADSTAILTTVNGALVTINKFVRNVTTPTRLAVGATIDFTWNAAPNEYYASSEVLANPGEILEYVVIIRNAGAGLSTNIIFQDTLPNFTSIDLDAGAGTIFAIGIDQDPSILPATGTPATATVGTSGVDVEVDTSAIYGTGATTVETIAAADGVINQDTQGLRIFPGNATGTGFTTGDDTGSNAAAGTGGTGGSIAGASDVIIVYQILVE